MFLKKRIFIIGGHLTPALALIDELEKQGNWEIFFVGRKYSIEGDKTASVEFKEIKEKGLPFLILNTGRLQRKFTGYTLLSLLKIPYGFFQSLIYLIKYQPVIIFSFGSYLSLPICLAGFILKIPIVIHEQTTTAGLANRITGLLAKKIFISYPSSQKYFPKNKTILTGNLLRQEIFNNEVTASWQKAVSHPLIYITGGSLGAHKINLLIGEILSQLLETFYVIHQTGESYNSKDFEIFDIRRINLPLNLKRRYVVKKYINPLEIGWVMNQADLIISRAGANTVAEIIALNKPAVFIPIPFSQEQKENAAMAKETINSLVLNQEKLTPENLYREIIGFWQTINPNNLKTKPKKPQDPIPLVIKEIYDITH